ncbi:LOW QUALITY PROTEIN: GSK3-beta interaction protein [Rhinoraja longicauda]
MEAGPRSAACVYTALPPAHGSRLTSPQRVITLTAPRHLSARQERSDGVGSSRWPLSGFEGKCAGRGPRAPASVVAVSSRIPKYSNQDMDCDAHVVNGSMFPNFSKFEEWEESDLEGADVKDMKVEAEAVVNDVNFAVSHMAVSQMLPIREDVAYINVETKERNRYCLELTEAGLRVVAYGFDQVDESLAMQYHETIYSLLDSLSPAYRDAFGNALLHRLEALKKLQQ